MNIETGKIVTAHCTAGMAAWLDPTGSLQAAGLLVVDMPESAPFHFVAVPLEAPKGE